MSANGYLEDVAGKVTGRFEQDRTLLDFDTWLEAFFEAPRQHARSSAQYLVSVFEHFGITEQTTPVGTLRRFGLFDTPFAEGRGRIAGHEDVAAALYRILRNFARQGRVDRMILLHGPNGSAKSTIVSALMGGVETYSHTPEGAVYTFNWIFPRQEAEKGKVGFGSAAVVEGEETTSWAHLPADGVDARIQCEMRDHPLLLIPARERQALLEKACRPTDAEGAHDGDFVLSRSLVEGSLCHKCRTIYEALMASYQGDWRRVMAHVQVERFYHSRRYLKGLVTVEPQMSVDAGARALSVDRSAASLPPALQTVNLIAPTGPLVHANRGIIEYADLLKRPLEAFKYLLGTCETGQVRMDELVLELDTVLVGSTNEIHLEAFKQIPDFNSFKGRMELVRVPYLRRPGVEASIYESQVTPETVGRHIAPHAIAAAARWAVLTRLKKPLAERYPESVRALVVGLSPREKLELYEHGAVPARLATEEARELRALIETLYRESEHWPNYEGRTGVSAREIKTALMNAAQRRGDHSCLTAGTVFEELVDLTGDPSVYGFLQEEVIDGYHDHEGFVAQVWDWWIDQVEDEVRDAMGLVAETQFSEWFERYVRHVTAFVQKEKIKNPHTGETEPPSEQLMGEMEDIIRGEEKDTGDFRNALISRIGAYRLDNPDADTLDWAVIFPDHIKALKDHYHEAHRAKLIRSLDLYVEWLDEDGRSRMEKAAVESTETLLGRMTSDHGYCDGCVQDALLSLRRHLDAEEASL